MGWTWTIGLVAPAIMLALAAVCALRQHRWRRAALAGAIVGGGFCVVSWWVLRLALSHSRAAAEIVFLQVALSTAGAFLFLVTAMVVRKGQTR